MNTELPPANLKDHTLRALGGAIVLTLLVFLLIPIAQRLDKNQATVLEYREVIPIQQPLPITPPSTVEPPPKKEPPKPTFEQQFDTLNLNQLERSINPGISGALAMGVATQGFETEINVMDNIQKMFTFEDLSQAPGILNQPRIQFPRELIRRKITEGRVTVLIEINEKGRATIIEIKSSTHPQLIKTARDVIRQARFTKPLVNGVAQKVRGEWPLILRAPQ